MNNTFNEQQQGCLEDYTEISVMLVDELSCKNTWTFWGITGKNNFRIET